MADEAHDQRVSRTCPRWCVRVHRTDDHDDDRLHQSEPVHLAVLIDRAPLVEVADVQPERLVLRLVRRPESATTWLELMAEERSSFRVVTTAESAYRLGTSLSRLAGEPG